MFVECFRILNHIKVNLSLLTSNNRLSTTESGCIKELNMGYIEGVVFDFNGTLFWDTKLHNEAWDLFLHSKNLVLTDEEKSVKIHGKTNKDILSSLFNRILSAEEIKKYSIEKEDIYQGLCADYKMELAPGAIELLDYLSVKEIKYTIATASDFYNVSFYFKTLQLDRYFDINSITYSDGIIASKPNPEIFEKAINSIGIRKENILIFEDSISGLQAAGNAGVGKTIIVDSNGDDYSDFDYPIIHNFDQVDRTIFKSA